MLGTLAVAQPAACEPFAYVTNQGGHSVSVVDLDSRRVATTVAVGEGPAGVAVSRDGRQAYVSDPKTSQVYRLDGGTHRVTAQGAAGRGPLGIALSPDAAKVYVVGGS